MRKALTFMVVVLVFSCTTDQVSPTVGDVKTPEALILSTTCSICSSGFQSAPPGSSATGALVSDSYYSNGYKIYSPQTVSVPANAISIGTTVYADAHPNRFKIYYLNASGGTVAFYDSDWMGYATYPGPWNWMGGISTANQVQGPNVNTGATSSDWPCPFIIPGTTPTLEYSNTTGSPANGVTWSLLSNSPSGSVSFPSNGNINQPVNFSSSFSSVDIQASTSDPVGGSFENCDTHVVITAPALSGITSIRVEVEGMNDPSGSTDYWHVNFGWSQNTSYTKCGRCY